MDGEAVVQKSIEDEQQQQPTDGSTPYSFRRKRRYGSNALQASRTPSVTPDMRPRVLRKSQSQVMLGERMSTTDSGAQGPGTESSRKRTLEMGTPPFTPTKRQRTTQYPVVPIALSTAPSRGSSDNETSRSPLSFSTTNDQVTDATSQGSESPGPIILSPEPTPIKQAIGVLKQEEGVNEVVVQQVPEAFTPPSSQPTAEEEPPVVRPTFERLAARDRMSIANLISGPSSPAPPIVVSVAEVTTHRPKPQMTQQQVQNKEQETTITVAQTATTVSLEPPAQNDDAPVVKTESPAKSIASQVEKITTQVQTATTTKTSTPSKSKTKPPAFPHHLIPVPAAPTGRVPRDYTLTPLLLSEPETAWIMCTHCASAFVQKNAYLTKSTCPRCERHSKLYGYMWPKTEKYGPNDKEERILDHRMINRFLTAEEEARARGRVYWRERMGSGGSKGKSKSAAPQSKKKGSSPVGGKKEKSVKKEAAQEQEQGQQYVQERFAVTVAAPKKKVKVQVRSTVPTPVIVTKKDEAAEAAALGLRRSGRARRVSAKLADCELDF